MYFKYSLSVTLVYFPFSPDTFRVISDDAVQDHPKYRPMPYRSSFEPRTPTPQPLQMNNNAEDTENAQPMMKSTKVLPQLLPDHRANNPHPLHCGFLNKNVRFLNEPICDVSEHNHHHHHHFHHHLSSVLIM